jgi:hypothetical protein
MLENRKHPRKHLGVRGWIRCENGATLGCHIKDISVGGAMLHVSADTEIPDCFRLYFSERPSSYRNCAVRWRKIGSVGVQFE